jgi:nucleoside-diphosphate-sugar epimerase
MRVLVVGGSGYVAGLVLPMLSQRHTIRVLDLRPPTADAEYVTGSATDYASLRTAVEGMDAVVHCAMGSEAWSTPEGAVDAFDVNVKSVHLTLLAARDAAVPHVVYISSLSVYQDLKRRRFDETVPADATDLYGLTKRLGEEVCRAANTEWGLSVNVLRLAWPTPDETWPEWGPRETPRRFYTQDGTLIEPTRASDLARAVLAALDHRDGYQLFTITGDQSARLWSTAKAREVLGWSPTPADA